jgi:hypothetical protein
LLATYPETPGAAAFGTEAPPGVKMFITSPSSEKLEAPPESVAELAAWALCTFSFYPSVATV